MLTHLLRVNSSLLIYKLFRAPSHLWIPPAVFAGPERKQKTIEKMSSFITLTHYSVQISQGRFNVFGLRHYEFSLGFTKHDSFHTRKRKS